MKYLREARAFDPFILAPKLREADKREIRAATGQEPVYALMHGYHCSKPAYTILNPDGEPIGMCGVVPVSDAVGTVWAVLTDDIFNHKKKFMEESVKVVDEFNRRWPLLTNCVDARNRLHIKWLQSIGAVFIEKHNHYGAENRPFLEFVRIKNV